LQKTCFGKKYIVIITSITITAIINFIALSSCLAKVQKGGTRIVSGNSTKEKELQKKNKIKNTLNKKNFKNDLDDSIFSDSSPSEKSILFL